MASIKLQDKRGFIDTTGKIVIPLKYDIAYDFIDNLAAVASKGFFGFIDHSGKEIIPLVWQNVRPFYNGLAAVMQNNKWGYINKKMK